MIFCHVIIPGRACFGASVAALLVVLLPAAPPEENLSDRSDILFTCDFESPEWYKEWGIEKPSPTTDTVAADAPRKFEPLMGKALRVRVDKGGHLGANLLFGFAERGGSEPEEIYFRYYLRLGDDWDPKSSGGKLPGISGTYGRAGWGGRPVDGRNGWSARGAFSTSADGVTSIGFYSYHADMTGKYGSVWIWDNEGLGYLRRNRWYCVEQFLSMNTPGQNDGILRGWIDGKLAFEKLDVRFRDVSDLKIEKIWLNVYHGGTQSALTEHHLYIDNVVIARGYIGPAKP